MKKSALLMIAILIALFGMFNAAQNAFAVDPPHNGQNSIPMPISCTNCHYDTALPAPTWATDPTTTDNTFYNNLCNSCHNQGSMSDTRYVVKTHSSQNSSGNYLPWTVECRKCHNPHLQDQVSSYPTDTTANLATGTLSANVVQLPVASPSSIMYVSNALQPNAWIDHIVVPNIAYPTRMYLITSNTNNSITVSGAINARYALLGNTYAIKTATMVIAQLTTPGGINATVKFFTKDPAQLNSYASSTDPANVTGICQVCHTQTKSFNRTNTTGSIKEGPNHPVVGSQVCTGCHIHTKGFKGECNSCHGYPPDSTATLIFKNRSGVTVTSDSGAGPGAHKTHVDTVKLVCANCHANGMLTGATDPAADDRINIGFNWNSDTSGNYVGNTSRLVYPLTGTAVTPGTTYRCSNLYCHSSGQGSTANNATPVYSTPSWTNPASGACGTCHQTKVGASLGAISSGSHTVHVAAAGVPGCGNCHAGAANDASSYDSTNHVNRVINVASGYDKGGPAGNGYGTCSAASCHGNVYGPGTAVTPTWGSTGSGCSACHSVPIAATGPATGSHATHAVTDCSQCHATATNNLTEPTANHADGDVDVTNGYPANVTKHASGSGYATCSTASCHANVYGPGTAVTPAWGATGSGCSACHSSVPIGATGPLTGSHALHNDATCTNCHNAGTTATTKPTTSHADGFINVTNGYPANKTKGSIFATCSAARCHGTLSSTWGANTAAPTCEKCHGSATTNPFKDTAGNTAATDAQVGAHATHLLGSNNYSAPIACTECHTVPTLPGEAGHYDTALPAENVWGTLAKTGSLSPSYAGGGGSCSLTYCHGNAMPKGSTGGTNKSPLWTDTAYLNGTPSLASDCSKCHEAPPLGVVPHSAGMTIADCTTCHSHFGATGVLVSGQKGLHINGIVEATGGTCNACHDYDVDSVTGDWGKNPKAIEGWGGHAVHINHLKALQGVSLNASTDNFNTANYNAVCGVCHTRSSSDHAMGGTPNIRTINFGGVGVNNTYQFSVLSGAPSYSGVTNVSSGAGSPKTCSNVSCHFQASPVWEGI